MLADPRTSPQDPARLWKAEIPSYVQFKVCIYRLICSIKNGLRV
jgi:hypothetical protein